MDDWPPSRVRYMLCSGSPLHFAYMQRSKECVIVFHHVFLSSRVTHTNYGKRHPQKHDCKISMHAACHWQYRHICTEFCDEFTYTFSVGYVGYFILGQVSFGRKFSEETKSVSFDIRLAISFMWDSTTILTIFPGTIFWKPLSSSRFCR